MYRGLRGSMGTLDHANPTRLSKRHQMSPYNALTKRAHFIPINNWFSSKDMAQLLYDKVYPLHRLPLQIISDRGVQYSAELFQE